MTIYLYIHYKKKKKTIIDKILATEFPRSGNQKTKQKIDTITNHVTS